MAKVCDVCGKKINGINSIGENIGGAFICSNCYKTINYRVTKVFVSVDEVNKERERIEPIIQDWPQKAKDGVDTYLLEMKKYAANLEEKERIEAQYATFPMTTGNNFEGYRITAYHGVVTGHFVIGSGWLSGWNAGFADISGTEADAFTNKLDEAKTYASNRAIERAIKAGGNALVAIDIEYTTLLDNLMACMVTGTSVTIEKIEK